MVREINADRESGGGMKLEHSQEQAGVHEQQTERGGECWERPLSCSGLAMDEYEYDDDDDITKVIATPSKSKHMMKIKVEKEIERINKFERKWKVQTSEEKFKIIPIAQRKSKIIIVNGKEIEKSSSSKLLGLSISSTGFVSHISKTINKGNGILS